MPTLPDVAEFIIGPRFARTRWLIRATGLFSLAAVQLCRQPVHAGRDVLPLRKPAPRKVKGQIGAVDAAFTQAHAGRLGIARTARGEGGRAGVVEIHSAIG